MAAGEEKEDEKSWIGFTSVCVCVEAVESQSDEETFACTYSNSVSWTFLEPFCSVFETNFTIGTVVFLIVLERKKMAILMPIRCVHTYVT